ncbi:MAG: hypothetical protein IT429_14105 [Gemmataceae bacterium]|nr:hypothetical protein [Gemmataceae bacterium]
MMRQTMWTFCTGVVLALGGGCVSGPLVENPAFVPPLAVEGECPNPMYVPLGPTLTSYRQVFDCALSVLQDYGFEILDENTFDGRIRTMPRVAPGLLRPWRPGNPALYDRLLVTLQSYRHRTEVQIQPADNGGYWVRVLVYKELEDQPRPVRATQGGANFRTVNDVERTFEVVDPTVFEAGWIPRGRDIPVEQQLLARMKRCL